MSVSSDVLNDEKKFMAFSEQVIYDIQRILYEKPGLESEKVISKAVSIEAEIYSKAQYLAGLKGEQHLWRNNQGIQEYVQLADRLRRSLQERDMSREDWIKEFRTEARQLMVTWSAEGRTTNKRKSNAGMPNKASSNGPKRVSTGGRPPKMARKEAPIPQKLPKPTDIAVPTPLAASPMFTSPAAVEEPMDHEHLDLEETLKLLQDEDPENVNLDNLAWQLPGVTSSDDAAEETTGDQSSWLLSRQQRDEQQQREAVLQQTKEQQREELAKGRIERLSEVQKKLQEMKESERAQERELEQKEQERLKRLADMRMEERRKVEEIEGSKIVDSKQIWSEFDENDLAMFL